MGILIVDDEALLRMLIEDLLTEEGYRVDGAADGATALQFLQQGARPCLIFLDLMMPIMNGWEFRQQQLRDPHLATIPVVIVSAVQAGRSLNALDPAGYLPKPLDFDRLLALAAQYCGTFKQVQRVEQGAWTYD